MEIDIIEEYSKKRNEETLLIVRGETGRTIILDSDDEINIRGDFVEIKTELGDIIQHKDTIVAMQTVNKMSFMETAMDELFDSIAGSIEIRDD